MADNDVRLIPRKADNSREATATSDLSYRGHLGEGTDGPSRARSGGSSLEGAGKRRLWCKGSRKEVDGGAQRVNALLSHLSCLLMY